MLTQTYLDDEALSKLRSLYENIKDERRIPCGSVSADDLAAQIIDLYLSGITDEREIRDALERPKAA